MIKTDYLKASIVKQFVEWLAANLDNDTLAHSYTNRRTGPWHNSSLYDAYVNYCWPHPAFTHLSRPKGSTFVTNAAILNVLDHNLRSALVPNPNDAATCTAAVDVMIWGGVRAGNVRWLQVHESGLTQMITDVRDALNANNTADSRLTNPDLRFNAGMTKVYSLICDSLIIYDSRVAAALGWAVTVFCKTNGLPKVPTELSFPWAPAKSAPAHPNPKQRNPSVGVLTFPSLRAGSLHAKWNLISSWILEAVLASPAAQTSKFKKAGQPAEQLRAVEAALFMIGYDLNSMFTPSVAVHAAKTSTPSSLDQWPTATPDAWNDCYTLARSRFFQYRITQKGIEVKDGQTFDINSINATLNILWKGFGNGAFPLANSATKVRNGTADEGLGTAYFQASGQNPPDTSKLAAVLKDLAIFTRYTSDKARGLRWTLNTDLLDLNSAQDSIDISVAL